MFTVEKLKNKNKAYKRKCLPSAIPSRDKHCLLILLVDHSFLHTLT